MRILWLLVGGCSLCAIGAWIVARYPIEKTMAERRRDAFKDLVPQYRRTQEGKPRKQWLRIERRRRSA